MGTKIRAEISERNDYFISKEKYYELKHFCLQYSEWKNELKEITAKYGKTYDTDIPAVKKDGTKFSRITEDIIFRRDELIRKMQLIEVTAKETDEVFGNYILLVVTGAATFDFIKNYMKVPISRNKFYENYRKFFWLLAQRR